jgi:hypothetical protein
MPRGRSAPIMGHPPHPATGKTSQPDAFYWALSRWLPLRTRAWRFSWRSNLATLCPLSGIRQALIDPRGFMTVANGTEERTRLLYWSKQ